jgi:hypothetical protein
MFADGDWNRSDREACAVAGKARVAAIVAVAIGTSFVILSVAIDMFLIWFWRVPDE